MTLKVYFDLMSQPSRSVVIFLRHNKINHTEKGIALRKGEHLQDAYAQVNPFKKVPFIEDEGLKLGESNTILRYLADHYLPDNHWYPRDQKQRAKVDEYLDWHHLNTRLNCAQYFRNRFMYPVTEQQPVNVEKVQKFRAGVDRVLADIKCYFLDGKMFISGDKASIADLQATCEIEQVLGGGINLEKNHPEILQWMHRVRTENNPHYADATKILYQVAGKLKAVIQSQKLDNGIQDD